MTLLRLTPAQRPWWQRWLVYALFISSTFTIAGDEASISLLMLFALWQLSTEGRAAWREIPGWVVAGFLALPVAALASALVNPQILTTLDHMRAHYRIFLPFALLPALAYVNLRRVLGVYAVCLGLMAVYGVIQYHYGVDWFRPAGEKLVTAYRGGVYNGKGNFTHHLTYAGFMLINVPFFLAIAATARGRERWAWAATSALAALATLVSLGRSGWLGMMVGLLVLAAVLLPRRWRIPALAGGVAVIVVIVTLLASGWLRAQVLRPNTPPLIQRLVRTGFTTDVDRLRLWESGWLAFQAKPVLGHGWGNQAPALDPYRAQVADKYNGYRFAVKASAGLHNIYLQMAFAVGVVGLAAYLYLWGAMFLWCARGISQAGTDQAFERSVLSGIVGGLAGSMAAGWFENNFLDGEVQTLIMMMMGLALFLGLRIRRQASGGSLPNP